MMQRTVAGRHPRVPRHRVRPEQARPAGRPALRADRPARPGDQVRRRRGAQPQQDGRLRLDQDEVAGQALRQADRRRPHPALQRPPGDARARLRARQPVAARARGGLRLRRDARPADQHRRGQGRHGEAGPDGPAHLRRRRLRQDRDRGARRLQGDPGRQAGGGARADDPARQPAPADLRRALRAVPRQGRRSLSRFQSDKEAKDVLAGLADGTIDLVIGTHRLLAKDVDVQGPRPRRHRRGAALRRRAQGAAQDDAHRRRRAVDVGDARSRAPSRWRSPASARCRPSPPRPRSATRCSPSSAPTTRSRSPPPSAASCCARARSSSSTTR